MDRSQTYVCPICNATKTIKLRPEQTTNEFLESTPRTVVCGVRGCFGLMIKKEK